MAGSYTQNIKIKAVLDTTQLDKVLAKLSKTYSLKVKVDTSGINEVSRSLDKINNRISKIGNNNGFNQIRKGIKDTGHESDSAANKTNKFNKGLQGVQSVNGEYGMLANGIRSVGESASQSQRQVNGLNNSLRNGVKGGYSGGNNGGGRKLQGRTTLQGGTRFSQFGEKYGNLADSFMNVGGLLGMTGLKSALIDTPARAETNKWLIGNMGDNTASGSQIYNTVDQATNKLPISMQSVIQPMYAFKSATGANAKQMDTIAPQFANFGAVVQNMTGSTELAETAMQKLSYGIQGSYAALDQFGVTEESLKATGKWDGDEKDVEGFMAAVTQVVGDASSSMNTFNGQVAMVSKSFSTAGKAIWEGGLGSTLKGIISSFLNVNNALGGVPAQLMLAAGGFMAVGTGAMAATGYFMQMVGSFREGLALFRELRAQGDGSFIKGFIRDLKPSGSAIKGTTESPETKGKGEIYVDIDRNKNKGKSKTDPSVKQIEKNTRNTNNALRDTAMNNNLPWLTPESVDKSKQKSASSDGEIVKEMGIREKYNRKMTEFTNKRNRRNGQVFLDQFGDLLNSDNYITGGKDKKGKTNIYGKYPYGYKPSKRQKDAVQNMGSRQRLKTAFQLGGKSGGLKYMGNVTSNSLKGFHNAINGASMSLLGISAPAAAVAGALLLLVGVFAIAYSKSQKVRDATQNLVNRLSITFKTIGAGLGDLFQSIGLSGTGGMEGFYEGVANAVTALGNFVDAINSVLSIITGHDITQEEKYDDAKKKYEDPNSSAETKKWAKSRMDYLKPNGKYDAEKMGIPWADEAGVKRAKDYQQGDGKQELISSLTPTSAVPKALLNYFAFGTINPLEANQKRTQRAAQGKDPSNVAQIKENIGAALAGLGQWLQSTVLAPLQGAWNGILGVLNGVGGWLSNAWNGILSVLGGVSSWLSSTWNNIVSTIMNSPLGGAIKWISDKFNTLKDKCQPLIDGFNNLKSALQPLIDFLNNLPWNKKESTEPKTENKPQTPQSTPAKADTPAASKQGSNGTAGTGATIQPAGTPANPVADNQTLWQQIQQQTATNAQQNSSNISVFTRNGVANVPTTIRGQTPAAMAAGNQLGAGAASGVGNGTAGMSGAAGTQAGKVPGSISSHSGSTRSAGHQVGAAGTNGFSSGLSGFGSTISSIVGGAYQTMLGYVHKFEEAGAKIGAALSKGAGGGAGNHNFSPGHFEHLFMDILNYTQHYLLNNVKTFETHGAMLGKSFSVGASKGENNDFYGMYYNAIKDTGAFLNTANTKYSGYSAPFGSDFTAKINTELNNNATIPSEVGNSNNKSSNGGNNIVNNFNIEKVDSKERVREIGETVVKMLSWNNETAGRIVPDPFPNQ